MARTLQEMKELIACGLGESPCDLKISDVRLVLSLIHICFECQNTV